MNNPLELESVIANTRKTLAQLLAIDVSSVDIDSRLIDDLGADSLDIVDLIFQLGQQYGCTLPKISVLDHAAQVCGDIQPFVSGGGLTENGKILLQNSLSAYAPDQLHLGMRPADVFGITTVLNWSFQCFNVFNYLPAVCPDCGCDHAELNTRQQVVCANCNVRLTPKGGDEVSRLLVEKFVETHLAQEA